MKLPNHILASMAILCLLGTASTIATAQPTPYYGALLYSMHLDTSVPPVYSGQPTQVTEGYLWLDDAMRLYPEYKIDSFMNTLTWSDSMKTIASVFYQAQDDNTLSFFFWSGSALHPNPYKGNPGEGIMAFRQRVAQIVGDTGRTSALLTADIISDVYVNDTLCVKDPTAHIAFDAVFVNSTILDEIKGKKVPLCVGEGMRTHRGSKVKQVQNSGAIPWATYPIPADSGGCLQFEYSPEWLRVHSDYGLPLKDSNGWWVKPGHEYIVFLNLSGIGADSTAGYFTVIPGPANPPLGSSGCMYPVVNGIVQDPNDDFGLGHANLPVAQWKAALRARISKIVNP